MRDQSAQGLHRLFSPRSVAVIGASADPAKVGHQVLASILAHDFAGEVHPIHPTASEVLGRRAYRTVLDVPGPVDLAVIAVPAPAVLEVADACGRKGVGGLVVLSAGFREAGPEGAKREAALRAILHAHAMRMVGPNCLGIVNADPAIRLHATFAPRPMVPGRAALMTQSGAMGIALVEQAARMGLGLSRFASLGNKADISGNDLLLLWEDDPQVSLILAYLESIGNPRNFLRIASRVGRKKPILLLKSGRTAQGARAAGSHTGALVDDDALVDALARQCGVIRVQSVAELFNVALAVDRLSPPRGPRVAVVTNSGGPGIMAVDTLVAQGLEVAQLHPSTEEALQRLLPPAANCANPVDVLASASAETFAGAAHLVEADDGVDALILIGTPIAQNDETLPAGLAQACRSSRKPTLAVLFGRGATDPMFQRILEAGPVYPFPEDAVAALSATWRLAQARARPLAPPMQVPVDREAVSRLLDQAHPDGWLPQHACLAILAAYGIPVVPHATATNASEAVAAADTLGYPVAAKMEVPGLVHKTEAGALRLGIPGPEALRQAVHGMQAALATAGHKATGILVMRMAQPGTEVLVGGVEHERYGPTVAVGLGGILTEVLRDVQFRFSPISGDEAEAMLRGLRGQAVLAGTRGQPGIDTAAVADVVARFGAFMADWPQVREAEINPLRSTSAATVALDARMRVAQPINA